MSAEYEENDINAEYDQNLNFIGGEIKVGDEVYVDTLDKVGKVTAVNKKRRIRDNARRGKNQS